MEDTDIEILKEQLKKSKNGGIAQSIENCRMVVQEDDFLNGLVRLNLLSSKMQVCKEVPWSRNGTSMTDNDLNNILSYMSEKYDLCNDRLCRRAVTMAAYENSFHPIRNFLDMLIWDGTERIQHALHHFLGAPDDELTGECMKMFMMGALSRVYQPGSKFEYVLTLIGGQGAGKSTFFRLLSIRDEWFTDDLVDFKSSRIYEKISGHWIMEMSEMLAIMNSKRAEEAKSFISRQSDAYREPYATFSEDRPRQCVFGATTNRQKCLPFDRTGNRRFLPIAVDMEKAETHILEKEDEAREYIRQMWAEAMTIFREKRYSLHFPRKIERQLERLRQEYMPEDTAAGLIQTYLEDYKGDYVCTAQLYKEALHNIGEPNRIESNEINDIMRNCVPDWMQGPQHRFAEYGRQRSWIRVNVDCQQNDSKSMTQLGFVEIPETEQLPFEE